MEREETIETTLGDLIVALTEETSPFVRNEQEAYHVAAFALAHLLCDSGAPSRSWHYRWFLHTHESPLGCSRSSF